MNKWLVGNGTWCAACQGTGRGKKRDRIIYPGGRYTQFYDDCAACEGEKRLAAPMPEIVAGTVPPTTPAFHSIFLNTIEYGREITEKDGRA
jgi:hypothetical protein